MTDHKRGRGRMSIARSRPGTQHTTVCLHPQALRELEELKALYFEIAGREVSRSIIVRRAVELLLQRVRGLKPTTDWQLEVGATLRHLT